MGNLRPSGRVRRSYAAKSRCQRCVMVHLEPLPTIMRQALNAYAFPSISLLPDVAERCAARLYNWH